MSVANQALDSFVTGNVHSRAIMITETVAGTTFTAPLVLPPGSVLLDIIIIPIVLWDGTNSELKVGYTGTLDAYFSTVNLVSTDLVLGERLHAISDNFWGATNNATTLSTAGRLGANSGNGVGGYFAATGDVIATVTKTAATGTGVGRTLMVITFAPLYEIAANTVA